MMELSRRAFLALLAMAAATPALPSSASTGRPSAARVYRRTDPHYEWWCEADQKWVPMFAMDEAGEIVIHPETMARRGLPAGRQARYELRADGHFWTPDYPGRGMRAAGTELVVWNETTTAKLRDTVPWSFHGYLAGLPRLLVGRLVP